MVKNPPANAGEGKRCEFDLWVGKIPRRRSWQPTAVFLPGESHGQAGDLRDTPWPEIQETQFRSLDQEDPLEEGIATHSSILVWRIPMDRGAWQAIVHRVAQSWT